VPENPILTSSKLKTNHDGESLMMKNTNIILLATAIILFTFSGAFAWGVLPTPQPDPPDPDPDPVEEQLFERFVAIGDSITHGCQSASVDETRQPKAFPALLAGKMRTDFVQGLIRFPGYFINIEDELKNNIRWWQYYYVLTGGSRKDNYSNQSKLNNFGITFADAHDGLNTNGSAGGYYELALGPNGAPQVTQALRRNPTFVSFWLGANDVLGAALGCDVGLMTPIDDFIQDFTACVDKIAEKNSVQGVVLANVPDVTTIAYLQETNDPNFPDGSLYPFWKEAPSNDMLLTPDDIELIQQRTAEINQAIENAAIANNWAFVDAHAIFSDIDLIGHRLKNRYGNATSRTLSTDFLGGIFSLDGVHPSITGHAIVANFFIAAINFTYDENLGTVDEVRTARYDSLLKSPVDPRGQMDGLIGDAILFVIENFF